MWLDNKPKLRIYDMLKSDFVQEPYITFDVPKFKIIICSVSSRNITTVYWNLQVCQ